jgi:hypothetical protein
MEIDELMKKLTLLVVSGVFEIESEEKEEENKKWLVKIDLTGNYLSLFLPIIRKSIHDVLVNSVQGDFFVRGILNCHCCVEMKNLLVDGISR